MKAFTDKQQKEILKLYKAGQSPYKIVNVVGGCVASIYNLLRRHELSGLNYKNFDDQTELEIVDSYSSGKSINKVAELFESDYNSIRRVLLRHKCNMKKRGARRRLAKRITNAGYAQIMLEHDDPYICMVNKNGVVMEHRHVMAKHLGRPLTKKETVHHIDGNRKNNNIENLQLRSSNHGSGVVHVCINCGSKNIKAVHI